MIRKYLNDCVKDVSRETFECLEYYLESLIRWNRGFNLVSRKLSIEELIQTHVQSSIEFANILSIEKEAELVDIGSGSGMPGIIIAIMSDVKVNLVERNFKKCLFLREVSRKLDLNVEIHNKDVIEMKDVKPNIIISKAAMSVNKILNSTKHLMKPDVRYFLSKGSNLGNELKEAKEIWSFKLQLHEYGCTNNANKILELSEIQNSWGN